MKTVNNSIVFLPLLIVTVCARLSDDHHYDTKLQDVTSHQNIETDYQFQNRLHHRFLSFGEQFGNDVFGSVGLGSSVFDSSGFDNGVFGNGGFGNGETNNFGLGSSGIGSSALGSSGFGSSGFGSSGFGGLRGGELSGGGGETTSKSPTKSPLSLPTVFPSNSPSDSEENSPSNSTSSSTEFSLCDPDDPNPRIMVWRTDNDFDFPVKDRINWKFLFMKDMYGFEFCNVDDIEYKAKFSIGSEGEWTTGYVGSMDQKLPPLKGIRVRSTGKLRENNIGIAVVIQAKDENGQTHYGTCKDGVLCDFFTVEVDGEIPNTNVDSFLMYPYFTDFNSQGEGRNTRIYPSNFLSNIQDSYCDPDDTSASILAAWNETSLFKLNLDGFFERGFTLANTTHGFQFCGGFLEYKASFADTAETEWTTIGFVGFRDKARPLKSIRIRPSGRFNANNITFSVSIGTRQNDLGPDTRKTCKEGEYCSFTGDNYGWDPVYIHSIGFDIFLKTWVFDRERDMSDYNYELVKERYGSS